MDEEHDGNSRREMEGDDGDGEHDIQHKRHLKFLHMIKEGARGTVPNVQILLVHRTAINTE